ncbi:hypothetical protein HZB00_02360 [Candidatus Woesearchaeota archaeon]|nr:hypothetical protein [Candidatus Woesearchaeota archaeon]
MYKSGRHWNPRREFQKRNRIFP